MSLLSDSKNRNWGGSDNLAVSLGGGAVTVCAHFLDCCLQDVSVSVVCVRMYTPWCESRLDLPYQQ